MRIISKFRDYYDIGLSYGVDSSTIYKRASEEVSCSKLKNLKLVQNKEFWDIHKQIPSGCVSGEPLNEYYAGAYTLVFCGNIINFITVPYKGKHYICTNIEDVLKYTDGRDRVCGYHTFYSSMYSKDRFERDMFNWLSLPDRVDKKSIADEISIATGSPIVLLSTEGRLRKSVVAMKDPCLKTYGLQSIIDPYTAFQEISMYLGSVLCKTDEGIIEIGDKYKLTGKGFNDVSFKTRKGTKKPRSRGG